MKGMLVDFDSENGVFNERSLRKETLFTTTTLFQMPKRDNTNVPVYYQGGHK